MERVASNTPLAKLLGWCAAQRATDIHGQAARRYSYRVDGKLLRIAAQTFPPPNNDELLQMLKQAFSASIYHRIEKQRETNLSFLCGQARCGQT
jgi:Tfp pilus assembly pilus retraction ATPase PilT